MSSFKWNRFQVLETISVYNTMFLMALLFATFGPTLLDLSEQVRVEIGDLTTIFPAIGIGYVFGSFIGGFLFDRFNRRVVLFANILGAAASSFTIPFSTTYMYLLTSVIFVGLFCGAMDAGLNSRIVDIWRDKSAPFMQALHFLYGIGSFVASLMAEPFLSKTTSNSTFYNNSNAAGMNLSDDSLGIAVPYCIGGALFLADAVFVLLLTIFTKDTFKTVGEESKKRHLTTKWKFFVFMVTIGIYNVILCGTESCLGSLLMTFAVEGSFGLPKSDGSFLTALYYGVYTAGRLMGIFVSTKVQPLHMLIVNIIIMLVGCLAWILSLHLSLVELLWVGTALLGLAISTCFPSAMMWTEKYVRLSGKVAAVFIAGTTVGDSSVAVIAGQLMKIGYSDALVYVVSVNAVSSGIMLILLYFMARFWTSDDQSSVKKPEALPSEETV